MVNPQYTEGVPNTNVGGRNSRHEKTLASKTYRLSPPNPYEDSLLPAFQIFRPTLRQVTMFCFVIYPSIAVLSIHLKPCTRLLTGNENLKSEI